MLTEVKPSETLKVSDEHRIELIRTLRNELIQEFLEEQNLYAYFEEHFKSALNEIRVTFIKKELQELFMSPVDLVHYSTLLLEMKHAGTASLTIKNEDLFFKELEIIFRKYIQ